LVNNQKIVQLIMIVHSFGYLSIILFVGYLSLKDSPFKFVYSVDSPDLGYLSSVNIEPCSEINIYQMHHIKLTPKYANCKWVTILSE
jgi:hypothetical protein